MQKFDTPEAAFAAERGITLKQAKAALSVMAELTPLDDRVQELVPLGRLGGVFIDKGIPPKLVVRLTPGPIPKGLRELAPASLLEIRSDASMSLRDRIAVVDEHTPEWQEAIPDLDGVYADSASDRVVLRVAAPEASQAVATVGARAAVAKLAQTDEPLQADGLKLVIDPTTPGSDSNRGGRDLSNCTSAFVVKVAGTKALLTAAHCGSPQRWYTFDGAANYATTYIGKIHNTYADMEWLQLAATPEAKPYYFGASTDTANQVPQEANVTSTEGTWACHRGKTTGWSCGSLQNVQYKPVYDGACPNASGASVACESRFVLVRGANLNNAGGDSGGPWVRGSGLDEPLGVHKGGNTSGDTWYSKLGNLPSNVSIWVA